MREPEFEEGVELDENGVYLRPWANKMLEAKERRQRLQRGVRSSV